MADIERINIPLGGTGSKSVEEFLTKVNLSNHNKLSIDSNGKLQGKILTNELTGNGTVNISNELITTTLNQVPFYKIHQFIVDKDGTTYSTSSTNNAAANGANAPTVTPTTSTSKYLVMASVLVGMDTDFTSVGFRGVLCWYDGSTYIEAPITYYSNILSSLTVRPSSSALYENACTASIFTQNELRDNGEWRIRWGFDSIYGQTTYMYESSFVCIEYDE